MEGWEAGVTKTQAPTVEWGTYRPNVYFGVKAVGHFMSCAALLNAFKVCICYHAAVLI